MFIAPSQSILFKKVKRMIPPGSSLLDVACATGRLGFDLATHCRHITGIDLSAKNINSAQKQLEATPQNNIEFIHGNALALNKHIDRRFDYAFTGLALHEMPNEIRLPIIEQIKTLSDTLIFADYVTPMRKDLIGYMVNAVEFFAGINHFRNYRHYQAHGGIEALIKESGLKIVQTDYSHEKTVVIYKTIKT